MAIDATLTAATITQTISNPGPTTHDHIQTLTDFHIRLQSVRHIPSLLLRPPSGSSLSHAPEFSSPFDPTDHDFAVPFHTTPAQDFRTLKTIADALRSEKIQEALKVARESEDSDKSDLGLFQRDSRKRKRPLSPVGSPQPYIPPPPRTSSLFPPSEDEPPRLRAEGLVEYIREFNRGGFRDIKMPRSPETGESFQPKCRLCLWSRTHPPQSDHAMNGPRPRFTSPVILRFTIEDVLTAYVSLVFDRLEDPLLVESVTAFGPREMKLPHMQSDYLAFQVLSQHVAKMAQSHPQVPLQTLIHLLVSYQGLFVDRCTSCERVLSAEGHVPPAGRLWIPRGAQQTTDPNTNKADEANPGGVTNLDAAPMMSQTADHPDGHWESRHVTCMYS
ncbi:hypothetical protein DFH29DRAFT_795229 [Suillus ampliporus]|nr:hypothetical protein DFH29DRAFT_795229 [Suillus ampliporus]